MSLEALKRYSPDEVSVVLAAFIIGGFADGAFVSVAPDEDDWSLTIGSDGSPVRAKSSIRSATITLTLLQTSASNQVLQDFANLDRIAGGGIFPLLIKDNSGNTIHAAEQCWVQRRPDSSFDREVTTREWILRTGAMNSIEGGN